MFYQVVPVSYANILYLRPPMYWKFELCKGLTGNVFIKIVFSQFGYFGLKPLFKMIEDNVVNLWNSHSILLLLQPTFLT